MSEGTLHIAITGATSGIGLSAAEALVRGGHELSLFSRSDDSGAKLAAHLRGLRSDARLHLYAADLSSLASVKDAANAFMADGRPLDVLINNAGMAGTTGLTADGFELAFGVNHLAHFLLTRRLEPALLRSAEPRIVNVASRAHFDPKRIPWEELRTSTTTPRAFAAYGVSKLANVLFAKEYARREPRIFSCSLHPGVVATNVWRAVPWPLDRLIKLFMLSNEDGALTTLHCALSAEARRAGNGSFFERSRPAKNARLGDDATLARELWTKSDDWVAPFLF